MKKEGEEENKKSSGLVVWHRERKKEDSPFLFPSKKPDTHERTTG
jgi:hypothetical protein